MTMHYSLRVAALLLTCLLLAQTSSAARYWESVGTSDEGEFDIDIASINKVNEGVVSVATRHQYTTQVAVEQMKTYHLPSRPRYGITTLLINCGKNTAATTEERFYDKSNKSLFAAKADRIEWDAINKGSILEAVAMAVCAREGGGGNAAQGAMSGTGFVVSANGHVVTNSHVVAGNKQISTVIDGVKRSLALLKVDAFNDMALLKLSEAPPKGVSFREGRIIRPGDSVVAVGYPLPGVLASEPNVTTGSVSALSGPENDTRLFQFTAPVQQGASGSPLLDDCGNVVGMVVGKLDALRVAKDTGDMPQNVNFAIHQSLVMTFLRLNGVEPVEESCQKRQSPAETAEKLRGSVLQILAE
jgi:S1-C subfamily serine protease